MAGSGAVRVALVYDCLFPWTVGGAERWYRSLAERLAAEDHEVTYLTLRQWERSDPPAIPGVRVVAVGPRMGLYGGDGRRRIAPPLAFGAGVLAHLLTHPRRYDVVHTASFPYFSLLAAGLARRRGGYALVVDWHEVWSAAYWREYLGPAGRVGLAIQDTCVRIPQRAFCFSRLHRDRLLAAGLRGAPVRLEGEYAGSTEPPARRPAEALVVFAGRHIPEKRVPAVIGAIAAARRDVPDLRGLVLGDGPEHGEVRAAIARLGLGDVVAAPGFVDARAVDDALGHALCLLLPSRREGYGLVVVEAMAHGTPSIVVAGEDNAAAELVENGVNGVIAPSAAPGDLAAAIIRVHEGGAEMRETTREHFRRRARALSLEGSLERVLAAYRGLGSSARR